ncbi:zinc finger protein 2-like [Amphibalanus amphitrite]|uniref:zinc finger protein 2-like n=1 Tax=Amphibalanus amphitrite TaxID=1232801 RepID=UPI001C90B2BA|nr:zinc finger protein 2-like [Amphibalanus amphitrite]XP_043222351.1 zinc finger protein 2-like [Amphibalanus amphitrite]XP_043222352.1 zinc finger protein 2-like [Amphibalanus amphitrite]XP_043222353.1 zinc finger protein 2-like [Amphibalanus amphitrite]XP_043222354.1 zinc finger protein 2-like [Amphibalanus amphitrite]
MSATACFMCCTISPGSVPALDTICLPSGKSVAEQLCRGLGGYLLPLMPHHVACISCQQTVSHLDQLWAEAERLQNILSDKFIKALHHNQEKINSLMTPETEGVPAFSSLPGGHLPSPVDVDDPSYVATKLQHEDIYCPPDDSPQASEPDSPTYVIMDDPGSLDEEHCHSQFDSVGMHTAVQTQNSSEFVDSDDKEIHQSGELTFIPNTQVTNLTCTDNTEVPETEESHESTPPSQASSRAARTGPKTCPHCGKTYRRWRDLDTHLSTHTGSLPHQCAECGRQFASRRRLTDHQRGHAGGWTCQICDKVFRHPSSLQHHRRQHEWQAPAAVCPICSLSLSSAAHLRDHLRTHSDERPFQCRSCPRAFRQASTLRVHSRIHSGERPFQCDACGKGFRARAAFMTHLQQHGAVEPRFSCDTCGKTFFYKSKMERHRLTHGGPQAACCEQCGATFSSVAALNRHQVTHSSQRPHGCPDCGRKFKEAGVLRKHQRQMHAADAAHECSVCGKRCAGPFKLSEHMRTHTGERPFGCPLCPKSFTQAVHLSKHQRTHQRTEAPLEFGTV